MATVVARAGVGSHEMIPPAMIRKRAAIRTRRTANLSDGCAPHPIAGGRSVKGAL